MTGDITRRKCLTIQVRLGGSVGWASDSWFQLRLWSQRCGIEPCLRPHAELLHKILSPRLTRSQRNNLKKSLAIQNNTTMTASENGCKTPTGKYVPTNKAEQMGRELSMKVNRRNFLFFAAWEGFLDSQRDKSKAHHQLGSSTGTPCFIVLCRYRVCFCFFLTNRRFVATLCQARLVAPFFQKAFAHFLSLPRFGSYFKLLWWGSLMLLF